MEALPDDLLLKVLAQLPFGDKKNAACYVCRRWAALLADPPKDVWGELCIRITELEAFRKQLPAAEPDSTGDIATPPDDGSGVVVEVFHDASQPDYLATMEAVSPSTLLAWVGCRSRGFQSLRVVFDIRQQLRSTPETAARYRAACGAVQESVLAPLLHLLTKCSTTLAFRMQDGRPWEHGFGYRCGDAALAALSTALAHATVLTSLELECICCAELPDGGLLGKGGGAGGGFVSQLTRLTALNCDVPGIQGLEAAGQLRSLNLSWNTLDARWLNAALPSLSQLTRLVLNECRLRCLPPSLAQLTSLQELDMKYNDIDAPHWDNGVLACLPRLRLLSLLNCRLPVLPSTISALTALQELDVGINYLTQLPESISCLTALTSLSAVHNELRCLPPSLGACTGLRVLDLSYQRVEEAAYQGNWQATTVVQSQPLMPWLSLRRLVVLRLPITDLDFFEGTDGQVLAMRRSAQLLEHFAAAIAAEHAAAGRQLLLESW